MQNTKSMPFLNYLRSRLTIKLILEFAFEADKPTVEKDKLEWEIVYDYI